MAETARQAVLDFSEPQVSVQKPWTLQWIAERWKPKRIESCADDAVPAETESADLYSLFHPWIGCSGERWLPVASANLIEATNFTAGGAGAFICLDLFNELGLRIEDARRLLDGRWRYAAWQQWKVANCVKALVIVSTLAYSLALSGWKDRSEAFPLGGYLPRSVMNPFTGREDAVTRHVVQDEDLPRLYYASHQTTYSFVQASAGMSAEERWQNGNFAAEFIRVFKRVPNEAKTVWKHVGGDSWTPVKAWVSPPNLYAATEKLETLVRLAREGKARFVPLDCSRIAEWFRDDCIDGDTRKISKGRRINARQDFRKIWREWTGVRPRDAAGMPSERFSGFSQAMKKHSAEIASGEMVYVTHMEKIVRGLFIGSNVGMTLPELMASRTPEAAEKAFAKRTSAPSAPVSGECIESAVMFDRDFLFSFLKDDPRAADLAPLQLRELARMADEGWTDASGAGMYRTVYKRTLHGRYYCSGGAVQMLPKWLRKELFGKYYVEADLGSAVVAIVANQAKQEGFSGELPEIAEMLSDKKAYRMSLVDEECGICYEDVKRMTTMVSYGCKCNPTRLLTEAEWACIQEAYCVEETMHDIYASRSHSALMHGLDTPLEKLSVALWAQNEKVEGFCSEMRSVGGFVIGKHSGKLDGSTVVRNAWGTELVIPKGKRLSFGKKLAHIYQGAESKLLWTIWNGLEVDGRKVKDIEGGFGLFIHDGFGIRRDIAERLGDPAKALHDFGDLKYDCES